MIGNLLRRLFSRPDPLDDSDEFLCRLEDEARRNQAIDESFARAYRDPVQTTDGLGNKGLLVTQAQLADMTPTQRDRCLGRESHIPPITRKRMLARIK